ncbi:serine protease grass [Drosophila simulans]|uniref:Peptidase S1 domain-containing protein n=1 Tax=Drosophila simulans TaxID=7240 RepID=A0A0J9R3I7_DROSI|nr:serine protease grass [Drosophila simulans]KMY90344.1 uncharacterized protein Dsimw501_GD23997 [Drosophila simulans]
MNTIGIGIVCLILPLLGSALFLDPACGIRAPIPTVPRIINGAIAPLRSSPWMAFLHTTDNYFVCGGTLITNRLVLTAAHCYLKNFTYTNLVARLGEYDRDDVEKCYGSYCTLRIEGKVDRGFKHRLFDPDTLAYDIALLRLKQRVEYRDNIRPICIVTDTRWRNYINSLDPLTGTGWGRTEKGQDSGYLRTVDLSRQDPIICLKYTAKHILKTQFCAGNLDSGFCNGDSGGPVGALIPYKKSSRFIQVGISSFGNYRCSNASVFTNVMSHVDWILLVHNNYT